MHFMGDTTGMYSIFNGEKHKVTLSGYYISPLIKDGEVKVIMGSHTYNPNTPNNSKMDYIKYFIEDLNRLSSLNFSLPSEAQWENAAMHGKIEFGETEWMKDKWDTSATIESNVNPVCESQFSSYYVVRSNTEARGCGHRSDYYCFRLVLMIS